MTLFSEQGCINGIIVFFAEKPKQNTYKGKMCIVEKVFRLVDKQSFFLYVNDVKE